MLCPTCQAVCLEDVEFEDVTCPNCMSITSHCVDCVENGHIVCPECGRAIGRND